MFKKAIQIIFIVTLFSIVITSCSINYNLTGSQPMVLEKTFTVYYFPNRAKLINPTLSDVFTENLREKLQRQTSLNELAENGDIEFEGQITGYDMKPMSIQKQDMAAQNRLTITVNLKYTNNKEPDKSFARTFSAYEDYDSSQSLSDVEDDLSLDIVKKLNEDIFNATIANW